MKKVFFAAAVAAMFGLAACNNASKTAEEATDSVMETVEAAACETAETAISDAEDLGCELVDTAIAAVQEVVAE